MTRSRTWPLVGIIGLVSVLILGMDHGDTPSMPDDLSAYEHVNTLVVPRSDSPIHGIHHFYVNRRGLTHFEDGGTEQYPDRTIFLGKVFAPVETEDGWIREGELVAYTLMQKDADAESTADTGGWHFVMYDAQGGAKDIDPAKDCFGCHEPSPETDFVLSQPLQ
jgi:hypothetical protein